MTLTFLSLFSDLLILPTRNLSLKNDLLVHVTKGKLSPSHTHGYLLAPKVTKLGISFSTEGMEFFLRFNLVSLFEIERSRIIVPVAVLKNYLD